VTVWGWTDDPTISQRVVRYTAQVLRRLGYRVRTRFVSHSYFASPPPGIFEQVQLIPSSWLDTSAQNFLVPWVTCSGAFDHGWYCDRALDRKIDRARALEATDPRKAARLSASIDRELVDRAALVPLVNPRLLELVSQRVRNYQFHPYWGLLADQMWLR
jgi:ABC-type transport system substrate-binding protein